MSLERKNSQESGVKESAENFRQLRQSLTHGMTREELDSKRHLTVAPGVTVGAHIETRIDFEEIEWRDLNGQRVLIKKD